MDEDEESENRIGEPENSITWEQVRALRTDWLVASKLLKLDGDGHQFMQALIADVEDDFLSDSDWLNRWVVVLDHVIHFNYLVYSCYINELEKTESETVRCFASLQSSIFDGLYSIRILIAHGRELAARKLLRSVSEHIELQLLLYFDPSLVPEFFSTHDEVAANKFWYKALARGKAGKKLYESLKQRENGEAYILLLEYSRDQLGMLGQLIHPSYISLALIFLRPINSDDDYIPFRYPIDASVRTIKHIVALMFLSLLAMNDFPLSYQSDSEYLHFDRNNFLHMSTNTARIILLNHLGSFLLETGEFFNFSDVA